MLHRIHNSLPLASLLLLQQIHQPLSPLSLASRWSFPHAPAMYDNRLEKQRHWSHRKATHAAVHREKFHKSLPLQELCCMFSISSSCDCSTMDNRVPMQAMVTKPPLNLSFLHWNTLSPHTLANSHSNSTHVDNPHSSDELVEELSTCILSQALSSDD